ncbi:hypothetical protein DY000_02030756 [Brassica cretica]|uniref:Uncharacterized protein n=1 Tax=Brassica cretica TaxID=69181 RepID=A0ABQ7E0S5_BRACR|nr:hypothetical protein DY000_02030756 [Brassica cretica]
MYVYIVMSRDYVRGRGSRDVWNSDAALVGGGSETAGLETQIVWGVGAETFAFDAALEGEGAETNCTSDVAYLNQEPTSCTKQLTQRPTRICVQSKAYLTNQEEFCHETNFHPFYTQPGIKPNWKNHQIYSDQEDMNFINRRFSTPSICEHPSLEVVSSQKKKRYGPNQNMEFKIDLLSSQQAKNEEKNPQKYGVMINFSKPDKPVLHLPYLEAGRLVWIERASKSAIFTIFPAGLILTDKIDPSPIHFIDPASQPATFGALRHRLRESISTHGLRESIIIYPTSSIHLPSSIIYP